MSVITGTENIDVPVEVLVLNNSEIGSLLTLKEVLDSQDDIWKAYGSGRCQEVPRQPILVGSKNFALCMPGYVKNTGPFGELGILAAKWGCDYPEQMPGIPFLWGMVLLLSRADNGIPFAIMEGLCIHNLKMAAQTAIAAKYLAKRHSRVIAMLGCGVDAPLHLTAFNELFPLEVVKVYDSEPKAMDRLAKKMSEVFKGIIVPMASAEEAADGADIICCIPYGVDKPVVLEPCIPAGCFVSGIGGGVDTMIIKKADKWVLGHQSLDEPLVKAMWQLSDEDLSHVYANMGQIATGKKAGRESDEERIVYTHAGFTGQDIALAITAYKKAVKQGVGTKLRLA